ncbi:MAG: hypothetical protein IJW86_09580 [Clostridia bacterium]|nr:hypothetical protein [Clostridia bacterium]
MDNYEEEKISTQEIKKQKLSSADKKGIALVVLLAAALIVVMMNVGSIFKKEPANEPLLTTTTAPTTLTTTQPSNENTVTTLPHSAEPESTNKNEEPDSTKPIEKTDEKQEILDVITKGINTLKASDASFKGHKEQVLDMELTECTAPSFVGIVNKILDMFIETEIYDYDFTDGKGIDPESGKETTTMETFPPVGKKFTLTVDGVAEATKEQQGENTVYRVKLKPEKSTKDNPKTNYHETACDTLDLSTFNMPLGEITKADLEYPGATVGITLDKDGRVIGYYEHLDIVGTGEAAAVGMTGGGTVEGYIDETWTIQWK